LRKHDPNAYKIFFLLLQPKTKIFELVQLIYPPNDTTVGNILKMIPENATDRRIVSTNMTTVMFTVLLLAIVPICAVTCAWVGKERRFLDRPSTS
jgi:hypothetical protein